MGLNIKLEKSAMHIGIGCLNLESIGIGIGPKKTHIGRPLVVTGGAAAEDPEKGGPTEIR